MLPWVVNKIGLSYLVCFQELTYVSNIFFLNKDTPQSCIQYNHTSIDIQVKPLTDMILIHDSAFGKLCNQGHMLWPVTSFRQTSSL